jgi:hypothetical protein
VTVTKTKTFTNSFNTTTNSNNTTDDSGNTISGNVLASVDV